MKELDREVRMKELDIEKIKRVFSVEVRITTSNQIEQLLRQELLDNSAACVCPCSSSDDMKVTRLTTTHFKHFTLLHLLTSNTTAD
ncbi:hypothetical protein Pcinc_011427 [Petrolisthes cinctipes]|uniref:Uncharacterized protein n=1 Tax=Petrolisthes cinctipes TaxID=88211 RepID=A0AAE1KWB8_PETCI|nr:hypothetical protein Pcinc_011427 [Petrolisthes cinctipes]